MVKWLSLNLQTPIRTLGPAGLHRRKLKRLGAITIFDAVWVLPDTPRTHEQFQWLAAEIQEMGGEAMFWQAQAELAGQEENLVDQFRRQVEEIYRSLLERMDQNRIESIAAAQEYQQIRQKDYFQSKVGLLLRERLLAYREDAPEGGAQ